MTDVGVRERAINDDERKEDERRQEQSTKRRSVQHVEVVKDVQGEKTKLAKRERSESHSSSRSAPLRLPFGQCTKLDLLRYPSASASKSGGL